MHTKLCYVPLLLKELLHSETIRTMKRFVVLFVLIELSVSLFALGSSEGSTDLMSSNFTSNANNGKVLVAYFSQTGNTQMLQAYSNNCESDILQTEALRPQKIRTAQSLYRKKSLGFTQQESFLDGMINSPFFIPGVS